jgi:hypothetical protein
MSPINRSSPTRRRAAGAVLLAGLALLIAAPAAGATARFATPTGSGTLCTQTEPCDIVTAVSGASENDDVTIGPGTYGSPTPLTQDLEDEGETISIHGQVGKPRPVIVTQAEYGFELLGAKTSISHVDVESVQGKYGIFVNQTGNVLIDHVISHVSAPGAVACYPSGTMTNSVCWSSGPNGIAVTLLYVMSATADMRNDTLIASGAGGTAVWAHAEFPNTMTINLVNSIALGAGADIAAKTAPEAKSTAIVNADHSNYSTVQIENGGGGSTTSVTPAGSGTNQIGTPQFVDAAAGDFREQGGSTATIDRGENSPLDGTTDLEGNPRALPGIVSCGPPAPAAVTDIGAYEYRPPVPSCRARIPARTKISKTKINRKAGKITFTFSATGPQSGFQCRLQKTGRKRKHKKKVAFSTCKSPKTYKHLRPGSYRFEVRALDLTGAPGPTTTRKVRLKPAR